LGTLKKPEREDGRRSESLVLSFRKGFETGNEQQSITISNDSNRQKSRLFHALRGLKDGVHLSRQLQHDFAVVSLVQIGLTTSNGVAHGRFIISAPKSVAGETSALTVWVTRAGVLEPLQTTGGWLVAPGKN